MVAKTKVAHSGQSTASGSTSSSQVKKVRKFRNLLGKKKDKVEGLSPPSSQDAASEKETQSAKIVVDTAPETIPDKGIDISTPKASGAKHSVKSGSSGVSKRDQNFLAPKRSEDGMSIPLNQTSSTMVSTIPTRSDLGMEAKPITFSPQQLEQLREIIASAVNSGAAQLQTMQENVAASVSSLSKDTKSVKSPAAETKEAKQPESGEAKVEEGCSESDAKSAQQPADGSMSTSALPLTEGGKVEESEKRLAQVEEDPNEAEERADLGGEKTIEVDETEASSGNKIAEEKDAPSVHDKVEAEGNSEVGEEQNPNESDIGEEQQMTATDDDAPLSDATSSNFGSDPLETLTDDTDRPAAELAASEDQTPATGSPFCWCF